MRIHLDRVACQGHGRCYTLAPALFGCDDEGYAVVVVGGDLAPAQQDDARLAADNCPEFAITVE